MTASLYDQYQNYINNYGTPAQSSWSGPSAYGLLGVTPGQNFSGDGSSQEAQAQLAQLQHFDPNARIVVTQTTNSDTGQTSPQYHFQYDTSKLPMPAMAAGGNLAQAGASGQTDLRDPNAVTNDPLFGPITATSNVRHNDSSWLDWAGPLAVMAFAGAFGGIPGISGLVGGGGGGFDPSLSLGGPMGPYDPGYGSMLPFNPSASDIGLAGDMTGFQTAGGATGAFNTALGGTPAAAGSLPGFQIPGGVNGLFGVAGSGIDPSTAAILNSINDPSLFDVGPTFDQAIADGVASGGAPGGGSGGSGSGGGAPSTGSGIDWSKLPGVLSKIPGIGGTGTGSGGGNVGLLGGGGQYNMQPYKSLVSAIRNFGLLGLPNG